MLESTGAGLAVCDAEHTCTGVEDTGCNRRLLIHIARHVPVVYAATVQHPSYIDNSLTEDQKQDLLLVTLQTAIPGARAASMPSQYTLDDLKEAGELRHGSCYGRHATWHDSIPDACQV